MSKKIILCLAIALALTVVLPACKMSASNVPQATATVASSLSTPTPPGMGAIQSAATTTYVFGQTQTAMVITPFNSLPSPTPTFNGTTIFTVVPPGTTPAAQTPVIIVPTATPGRPLTYTLQQGEYPYCLARRFNVDPAELLQANGLSEGDVLQPGTVLQIPQTGNPFPGTRSLHAHPAQYTVTLNDTIYRIACYYGDVDPTSIAAANSLTAPYTLTTGRVLNIP